MSHAFPIALALIAVAAPSALALPGDEPIVPVGPEASATVTANLEGIAVSYTCPVYRTSDAGGGFAVFGGTSSYGAALATTPQTGTDGRLLADAVVARDTASTPNTLPTGQCQSVLGDGRSTGPQATPGTYWWQAFRICAGCAGSYEVTEVRQVTVRSAATLAVLPPQRLFAGYLAPVSVAATDLPDGTVVTVQRQVGATWRAVGTGVARRGEAEIVATLPAGSHGVRATATTGSQEVTSPTATVRVQAGARRSTSPRDDGKWAGRGADLRVANGGRTIRGLSVRVTMLCPTVPAPGSIGGQFTTQAGVAALPTVRIAPDGSFIGAIARSGSSVLMRGRLSAGRLTGGRAQLSVGTCSGEATFTARRE